MKFPGVVCPLLNFTDFGRTAPCLHKIFASFTNLEKYLLFLFFRASWWDLPRVGVFSRVPVFSVPVWMSYRTYRSVRYRYWCRTDLTEVSGTGDTGGIYRQYIPPVCLGTHRTEHSLLCMLFKRCPLDYHLKKKVKNKNVESPWIWKKANNLHFLGWFLRDSDSELHILVRSQKQIFVVFVQMETGFLC